jgi:repressor LexA
MEQMAKQLSRRQQAVLEYIERFLDDNTYPPTIREIQRDLDISSTSVVDYNLNILEQRNLIRRNRNISRGIEVIGRPAISRNIIRVPVVGQIAAGLPIPVFDDLSQDEMTDQIDISTDLVGHRTDGLFALRVKGLSMIDALINDADIVILRQHDSCESGATVAVWLRNEKETTLKRFYLEGERVRLQPANATMDPIFTSPDNVEIQGKLVTVVRPFNA